jgi:hypothetical protein
MRNFQCPPGYVPVCAGVGVPVFCYCDKPTSARWVFLAGVGLALLLL